MHHLPPIAIVYDHLTTEHGGAEVVLQALLDLFPQAHLYSTVCTLPIQSWLGGRPVTTSFLQRLPNFLRRRHQMHAVLAPLAIESLHITEPLVLSVSAGAAKGVLTRPNQLHICYLLTPTRYLYEPREEVLNSHFFTKLPIIRQLANKSLEYIYWWDLVAASRPDTYLTISHLVSGRVEHAYHRASSAVIYPPPPDSTQKQNKVEPFSQLSGFSVPRYILSLGRHVWYKRIDIIVSAAIQESLPTIIAGTGAETAALQKQAGNLVAVRQPHQSLADFILSWLPTKQPIAFVGTVTNQEVSWLFSHARCFIMPGVEDFGLTAMESLLHGCPVIINEQSGVAEILDDSTAIFLKKSTPEELIQALKMLSQKKISPGVLKNHALRYGVVEFKQQIHRHLIQAWSQFSSNT